jgi:pimeloyl-ACP methyl ester carboxylesterase
MVETTTSRNGTTIAYERLGRGEPLIVAGVTDSALAEQLASFFTVVTVGQLDSVAELSAVIEVAGGEADVYSLPSTATVAAQAVAEGLPIRRLALFEPDIAPDDLALISCPTLVIERDSGTFAAVAAQIPRARLHVLDNVALADVLEEFFG